MQQIQTTSSKHLSFRSNEKGITLIETIASMLIVGFAFVGLYQAFAYGDIFVDKTGVRRMAIGYVQAELEYWRKIRDRQVSSQLLKFSVGQNEKKTVELDRNRKLFGELRTVISSRQFDQNLSYQKLSITLTYSTGWKDDSLQIATRLYME